MDYSRWIGFIKNKLDVTGIISFQRSPVPIAIEAMLSTNSQELGRVDIVLISQHSNSKSGFSFAQLGGYNTLLPFLRSLASLLTTTLIFLKLYLIT